MSHEFAFDQRLPLLHILLLSIHYWLPDGKIAYRQIDADSHEEMLHATNHTVLPQFMHIENQAFPHSITRYHFIENELKDKRHITKAQLKDMLLTKYPQGLCFHNYAENFGTTKSMILAPREGTIEICWGGQAKNCWQIYDIAKPMATTLTEMQIEIDPLP